MDGVGREPNDGEDDGTEGEAVKGEGRMGVGAGADWVSRIIIGH